jgi:hypothetical protein
VGKATGSIHSIQGAGRREPPLPYAEGVDSVGKATGCIHSIQGAGRREPPLPYAEGVDSVGKVTGSNIYSGCRAARAPASLC